MKIKEPRRAKMIKAILSDGGNILFSDKSTKMTEFNKISEYIPSLNYEDFSKEFRDFKTKTQTVEGYGLNDAVKDYLTKIGQLEIAETIYAKKEVKQPRDLKINPGIKETLEKIKSMGIKFIVMPDSTKKGYELHPFLEKLEINDLVTDVVSSMDVGVRKPDPSFFDFVLKKHGLNKNDVLFIAHDDDELIGAQEQGFYVVAFNFDNDQDLSYLSEEQKLKEFGELIQIINNFI
jgi:FMN phosphatase YigB (HAD superfamily)